MMKSNNRTQEERAMRAKNLFAGATNQRGETAVFTGLGLASVVMVLFAISSMAHFAAGLDNISNQTIAKSPTAVITNVAAATKPHRSLQSSVVAPRPGVGNLLTEIIPGR
jgi:hypothetical protein